MESFLDVISETDLSNVLERASRCCDGYAYKISVITVCQQGILAENQGLGHRQLKQLLEREDTIFKEPCRLRLFFLNGQAGKHGWHVHLHSECLKLLHKHCGMTSRFVTDVYNCDSWTMFPTSSKSDTAGTISVQYGFWEWKEKSTRSFIQLLRSKDSTTYFGLNIPMDLQTRIFEAIKTRSDVVSRIPLFVDMVIMEHVLASYRVAIGEKRTDLRKIEKDEKSLDETDHEEQAKKLHELSILWHTSRKDLADIARHLQHLKSLVFAHKTDPASASTYESLRSLEDTCLFWQRWVDVYKERTAIRINLMHHLSSQRIAVHTQRDGVSMFTLATVTAVFLPGTFVCSVLSTVFFDYDQTGISVSSSWWVLPAAAIPLTGLVLALWFLWFRHRLHKSFKPHTPSSGTFADKHSRIPGILDLQSNTMSSKGIV